MPARSSVVLALGAVLAILLPVVASAATPGAEVVVAVTGVSGDATEDNGQQKLARGPDGTLFLIYSAPNARAAAYSGSKYSAPGDEGEGVFVSRSDDDGATWVKEGLISRADAPSRLAAIAVGPGGDVHASWVDFETIGHVWHSERVDGVWQPGAKVSPGPFYAGFPALAVSDDAVHLLWYAAPPDEQTDHGSRYEIEHTIYSNGLWSEPALVSTNSQDALNPTVVRDRSGIVHTAWYQVGVSTYRANYASWDGAWKVPRAVSPPETNATGVAMDVAPDGIVHLVWEQVTGDDLGVAYARLEDGAWSAIEVLSERGARDPVIAGDDSGRVFAVWSRDDMIESRVLEDEWGPVGALGAGAHPVLLSGETVRGAWTRSSGDGHDIVFANLMGEADPGGGPGRLIVVVGLAVLLGVAVTLAIRRRARA